MVPRPPRSAALPAPVPTQDQSPGRRALPPPFAPRPAACACSTQRQRRPVCPVDELPHELVKRRGAQDADRDRSCECSLLVRELRRPVSGGELIGSDDRNHDHARDAGACAFGVQIPGRSGEELRCRRLLGRRTGADIDDCVDADERVGEARSGDHVDAVGARDRNDLVSPTLEPVDHVTADPARRSRDRDLHGRVYAGAPPETDGRESSGAVLTNRSVEM